MTKIIEINNLHKKFIVEITPPKILNLFKKIILQKKQRKTILALNGINFELNKGDRLGLIGDNGSGKSTLLRIIAGLYRKTEGQINIKGEVSAFLELGIGMERELTAFENIFLFGAIMGISKGEIKRRLDEIVGFSEIGDLLFCPLRDLSFGTIQRLALSISRYINSDILLLDEMFSSADIGFRNKYSEIFDNYSVFSKTIILTSHQVEIIKTFCNKCLLLDKGNQISFGPTEEVLNTYLKK